MVEGRRGFTLGFTCKCLNHIGRQLINGIHAAFTGRIGKDTEVRTARDGKPWASFPCGGGRQGRRRGPATWVRVALFGDAVSALAPRAA